MRPRCTTKSGAITGIECRGNERNKKQRRAKAGDRIALEHKKEAAHSKMSAKCTIKNGRKRAIGSHWNTRKKQRAQKCARGAQ